MEQEKMNENLNYVKETKDELLNLYKNKYVLIYNKKVVGSFDTYEAAAEEGIKSFGIEGEFLVHYITETNPINFVISAKL